MQFIHETHSEFLIEFVSDELSGQQCFVMSVPVMDNPAKKEIHIYVDFFAAKKQMLLEIDSTFLHEDTNVRIQILTTDKKTIVLDQVEKITDGNWNGKLEWKVPNVESSTWILRLAIEPIARIDPPKDTLSKYLSEMLKQGVLTDFVIKTDSKDFPCHKVVLAGRSQYFLAMFQSDMKEAKKNVLDWSGVYLASTVEAFLGYIYELSERPITVDNSLELFKLAHFCLMEDLQKACISVMKRLINPDGAVAILQLAIKYKKEELKIFALNFIVKTFDQCKETSSWTELSRDNTILSVVFQALKPGVIHFQ